MVGMWNGWKLAGSSVGGTEAGRQRVGADLDAPRVAGDGRDVVVGQPRDREEAEAGRVAARVRAPALLEAARHLPGPHEQDVAGADRDLAELGRRLEVVGGDRVAVVEPVD